MPLNLKKTYTKWLKIANSIDKSPQRAPIRAFHRGEAFKMGIQIEKDGAITLISIHRPARRNAVDRPTAEALSQAFEAFEQDDDAAVAILTGSEGHFCAGADLKAVSEGRGNRLDVEGDGPMGPTRMVLSKPVIAAIEGYCLAGGLELAAWCDMRVASEAAIFGVACRRWGVPLIDGGTIRLPRLIGESHAMDLILTGRNIDAQEARHMGLVNRVVPVGQARQGALDLANHIASFPPICMRADLKSVKKHGHLPEADALKGEFLGGMAVLNSGETLSGATRFAKGAGRGGIWPGSEAPSES